MKIKAILLAAVMVLSLLPGCTRTENVQIAATTLPVYQFTAALCEGTGISVARLVTENVSCLHDYSLNVSQVRCVESAEVVVLSGAGLESFMDDMISNAKTTIDSSKGIQLLSCEDEHEEHHGHHHHHHEADSHIWLSLPMPRSWLPISATDFVPNSLPKQPLSGLTLPSFTSDWMICKATVIPSFRPFPAGIC